ncbi:MAG: phosphatase PAP2 family protein [Planctomycetota bacterium]
MTRRRWTISIALFGVAFALASWLDRPLFWALFDPDVTGDDWYWMLRILGDLRVWAVVSGALLLAGLAGRRPASVMLGAIIGGAITELGKLLVGRERPINNGIPQITQDPADPLYIWKGPLGAFSDSSNLGIPSSHTGVALGGAAALALLFPRVGWLAIPLALGCGVSRMLTGAHYASDVVLGAGLGLLSGWLAVRLLLGPRPPADAG